MTSTASDDQFLPRQDDVAQAQPKRRSYNASASLSEYGIFPECDAAQAPDKGADVALPPLPNMDIPSDSVLSPFGGCVGYSAKAMVDYAQSAVIASRNQANGGLRESVAKWIKLKDSYCHVHDYPDMLNAEQKVRRILSGSADRQQRGGDVRQVLRSLHRELALIESDPDSDLSDGARRTLKWARCSIDAALAATKGESNG